MSIRKILVVTLSNLGDVILTLPVFQSLKEVYPDARLDAVVGINGLVVLEGDGRFGKIRVYDKKASLGQKIRFLSEIRGEHYDLIVDLRCSIIGILGGARRRNRYFQFLPRRIHRTDKHLSALRGIVSESTARAREASPLPQNFAGVPPLPSGPFVAAAVGSKSDTKIWPAEYFAALLDQFSENDGYAAVLIGDDSDRAVAERVKSRMRVPVVDLVGQTDFKALSAVIGKAALVVTNDSAPLHLADYLKVPVLGIFGPTDAQKYGPRGPRSAIARKELFCSPCEKAQCRYGHECLKELLPEEVYKKAKAAIAGAENKTRKILVVRLDRIGDVVLTLPAIAALKEAYPDASISIMTRTFTRDLLLNHPLVDEVIPYDYEKGGRHGGLGNLRFIEEIRRRRFDAAYILHPGTRSNLVPFLAGIPVRVGYDRGWSSVFLTHRAPDKRHEGTKHESEYVLDVLRASGLAAKKIEIPRVPIEKTEIERIVRRSMACHAPGAFIAIHPGASCPSKRWPVERFEMLGERIIREMGAKVVVVGGAEEKEWGVFLASRLGASAEDLTGRLNLSELAALLSRARALVSNDSGPVHVASAVGARCVVIFGRNQAGLSVARWRPLGEGHEIIRKDVGCVVCLAHACPIGFECLKAISVDEVFERLNKIANENSK